MEKEVDSNRVRLTAQYRHLGNQIHLSEKLIYEVKARMGQAMQVYRRHRRHVFQNRLLQKHKRVHLFQTLVLSVLQYNIGAWYDLSVAEMRFFRSKLYAMYRGLCRAEVREDTLRYWNDSKILAYIGLPDADTLIHGARLRYAMTLGRTAPEELWALLSVEYRWLSALGASIDWFKEQKQGFGPDKFGN